MRGIVSLLTMGAFLGAAWSFDDVTDKDLMLIQGRWDSVSIIHSGKEVTLPNVKNVTTFVIDGEKVTYVDSANGKPPEKNRIEHRIKLDSTKTPKHIDYTLLDDDKKEKTVLGIFDVKGDELRLCLDLGFKGRPEAFESKADSGHRLTVFKRVKGLKKN